MLLKNNANNSKDILCFYWKSLTSMLTSSFRKCKISMHWLKELCIMEYGPFSSGQLHLKCFITQTWYLLFQEFYEDGESDWKENKECCWKSWHTSVQLVLLHAWNRHKKLRRISSLVWIFRDLVVQNCRELFCIVTKVHISCIKWLKTVNPLFLNPWLLLVLVKTLFCILLFHYW
jgi:hypothetical protein